MTRSRRRARSIVRATRRCQSRQSTVSSVVDTTGAGDLYAAGFLYGYTPGATSSDCGDLGSLAAGLVIQQIGPRPRQNLRDEAQAGLL